MRGYLFYLFIYFNVVLFCLLREKAGPSKDVVGSWFEGRWDRPAPAVGIYKA